VALIHRATLSPSKDELLTRWLPSRAWFSGTAGVERLGAYRFDDPAGEVGIEAFLLRAEDGSVVHVPLTYRGAPLAGAEGALVGTTEHSVLGRRWVYDGCADPVFATALAMAVLGGGTQVAEFTDVDGRLEPRQPTATVAGSGTPGTHVTEIATVTCRDEGPTTVVRAGTLELVIVRVVGAEVPAGQTLTGRWAGGGPAVLAGVTPI
jgi:hypothetical protein